MKTVSGWGVVVFAVLEFDLIEYSTWVVSIKRIDCPNIQGCPPPRATRRIKAYQELSNDPIPIPINTQHPLSALLIFSA